MSQIIIVEKDGRSRPYLKCEFCHCPIEDASCANLTWNHGPASDTKILCKECDHKSQPDRMASWDDLDTAWFRVSINSGVNIVQAKEKAELLGGIGL